MVTVSEWWDFLQKQRKALRYDGVFWRKMAFMGAAKFPEWFRRSVPSVLGGVFCAVLPKSRKAVQNNVSAILQKPMYSFAVEQMTFKLFAQYAECLTDALELSGKPEANFTRSFDGIEHYNRVCEMNQGVILLTAHTGSWEVGGKLLAKHRSRKITMVMAEENNPGVRHYADSLRRTSMIDVVYASGHDPTTALTLLRKLRANEIVAVQIDRPPKSGAVIKTTLFAKDFCVPEGPFRLAKVSGAPILPVFLRRSGYRSYTFVMDAPLYVSKNADEESVAQSAQKAVNALERFVRAYPDQWFHFAPLGGNQ